MRQLLTEGKRKVFLQSQCEMTVPSIVTKEELEALFLVVNSDLRDARSIIKELSQSNKQKEA